MIYLSRHIRRKSCNLIKCAMLMCISAWMLPCFYLKNGFFFCFHFLQKWQWRLSCGQYCGCWVQQKQIQRHILWKWRKEHDHVSIVCYFSLKLNMVYFFVCSFIFCFRNCFESNQWLPCEWDERGGKKTRTTVISVRWCLNRTACKW